MKTTQIATALPRAAEAIPQSNSGSLAAAPLARGTGYELPRGSERVLGPAATPPVGRTRQADQRPFRAVD
jgi:hypothetical protein